MTTKVNALDRRLAERLRQERDARGWSTAQLAERSGVSKAMISKVERAEASPTASLLGRLSGAFGLTLSALLARAETSTNRLSRRDQQPIWQDPATGFRRRAISPAGSRVIELVQGELPPGASISYPASAYTFIDQQIWMLEGVLTFIEGDTIHDLHEGDCLELDSPRDCRFDNRSDKTCSYLVVLARHR